MQLDYYRTFISCQSYMQRYLTQNRPNHVRSKEFLKANPDLKNFFDDQLVEELRCEAVLIAEFPPERVYLIKIGEELSIFSIDSYENGQAN